MSVYVAPAAMGLGDLVVALPVVHSLIAGGNQVYLIVRMEEHVSLAHRIVGLSGVLREWEFDTSQLRSYDRYYDLRDHDLQREHWWGSRPFQQTYPDYLINDLLKIICTDLGLSVDFSAVPKLRYEPCTEARGKVAFVPGSAVEAKCWSPSSWLSLAQRLSAERLECIVVGQPDHFDVVAQVIERGLQWHPTANLADAVDVLSSCRAVVSVDTGLMHVAVNQGTPTVGMFRHAPAYVRNFSHFLPVIASRPCADECYEQEVAAAHHHRAVAGPSFQPVNWSCVAASGQHCMNTISTDMVALQLTDLLVARAR